MASLNIVFGLVSLCTAMFCFCTGLMPGVWFNLFAAGLNFLLAYYNKETL